MIEYLFSGLHANVQLIDIID